MRKPKLEQTGEPYTELWCSGCQAFHLISSFANDHRANRARQHQASCKVYMAIYAKKYAKTAAGKDVFAKSSKKYAKTPNGIKMRKKHTWRYIDRLRSSVRQKLGGHCTRCGEKVNLEFDHVNDNGKFHRIKLSGRSRGSWAEVRWMRDAPLEEVLYGKYAIQLLCNECHRTKHQWAGPDGRPQQISLCLEQSTHGRKA